MVADVLVTDKRIDDGRKLLTNLVRGGFEIAVAFWARRSGSDSLYLFIASPRIVPKQTMDATTRLYNELQKLPSPTFDFSDVRLISDTDLVARDAIEHRDRDWGGNSQPVQVFGQLGNLAVEWAYVYERITGSLTRDEVIHTVANLMNRVSPLQPSTVTLRDGSVVQGIPVGLAMSSTGVTVTIEESATGAQRAVLADTITNID